MKPLDFLVWEFIVLSIGFVLWFGVREFRLFFKLRAEKKKTTVVSEVKEEQSF